MDENNIAAMNAEAKENIPEAAAPEEIPEDAACCSDAQAEKIAGLEAKAAQLEEQAKEYLGAAQRVQAEFDNFRKRNNSVRADAFADGTISTIKALLPVLDNFERALSAETEDTPFRQGVEGIYKQLMAMLDKLDVELIKAEGAAFDPNIHEAVMRDEGGESGNVSRVLQNGYITRQGRVIRFAMVGVYA